MHLWRQNLGTRSERLEDLLCNRFLSAALKCLAKEGMLPVLEVSASHCTAVLESTSFLLDRLLCSTCCDLN